MVLWNILDGGPSHSGFLLGPSESIWGDTPGTNPRHMSAPKPLLMPNKFWQTGSKETNASMFQPFDANIIHMCMNP
jgi:hypothetical protein